jgi:hypothetical protein
MGSWLDTADETSPFQSAYTQQPDKANHHSALFSLGAMEDASIDPLHS